MILTSYWILRFVLHQTSLYEQVKKAADFLEDVRAEENAITHVQTHVQLTVA